MMSDERGLSDDAVHSSVQAIKAGKDEALTLSGPLHIIFKWILFFSSESVWTPSDILSILHHHLQ